MKLFSEESKAIDVEKIRRMFPTVDENVAALEAIQNHRYANGTLAIEALFHSSALVHWPKDKSGLASNERLEFLGDSFLNFFVSVELMKRHADLNEGELSKLRAAIVGTSNLIRVANGLGLGRCLILGKGDLNDARSSNHSFLADAFEAVTAALLIDAGEEMARKWLLGCLENDLSGGAKLLHNLDAKSRFQEWLQAIVNVTPRYELVETEETEGGIEFVIAGFIFEEELARAKARNKREASRLVAHKLLALVESGELTREKIEKAAKGLK